MALPKRILKVILPPPPRSFPARHRIGNNANTWQSLQETERLISDSPPGISAIPHEDNLRYFDVLISGPESSPFEGAIGDGFLSPRCLVLCADLPDSEMIRQAALSNWSSSFPRNIPWLPPNCAFSQRYTTPTSVQSFQI
jgi:hypothetical protein